MTRPLVDLRQWFQQLGIPLKGVFSRDEARPENKSPCIINLDDFGSTVCCRRGAGGYEYLYSFSLPPLLEWKNELGLAGERPFLRNNNRLRWKGSVHF